jgi:putative PIN family toxin of toxin-antitoxin system
LTRAVFDPNVLVAALIAPNGASAQCMRAHAEGRFQLVVCAHLLAELEGVLLRPKFRRYLTHDQAERFLASLRREAEMVADPDEIPVVSADPSDDYLVALARAGRAHVLVSGDPHLTSLRLPDLLIVSPRRFLDNLP